MWLMKSKRIVRQSLQEWIDKDPEEAFRVMEAVMQRREVQDAALLMRLRARFKEDGLHLRRPGKDRTLRAAHGAWFAIDDAGQVQRSAAQEGHHGETLRELAKRLGLLAVWEK
jgi:hypothetical protein